MKKALVAIALFLMAAFASAQTGCTPGGGVQCSPNLNLWLLPQHYQRWDIPWNANATELDTFSLTVPVFAPVGSQTITQPSMTYFNVNALMNFGTNPAALFGVTAGAWDSALTRTGAGVFSLDTTTYGNHLANLSLNGLKVQGVGGTIGQCLGSDGTYFDVPVSCITSVGSLYYQTVELSGAAQTQRAALNFSSAFVLSDSSLPSRTNVDLALVGTAGTYASPSSITFDAYGRETAVTASLAVNRICNATSCYRIEADGTIEEWGQTSLAAGGSGAETLSVTFPHAFSTTTNLDVVVTGIGTPNGDGNPHPETCQVSGTASTAGFSAILALPVQIGGSGYSSIAAGQYCSYHVWGR